MPLGAIIGGVSSLAGSLIGGNAASKAAKTQEQAAKDAQNLISGNASQALDLQKSALGQEQGNLNPYMQSGTTALSKLGGMQPFQAPTAEQAAATPGYQFQLTQGLKALQNSAAARGGLLSGGTSKAINDYAQGQAASSYGNTYNRALQTYQTNFGNQYALAGQGLNAGTSLSGLEQSNANAGSGILGQSAAEQAQQINNAGAARASGYVARGNAIGGGISGFGNALGNGMLLSQLNGQQQPDQVTSSGSNTWYGYGQPGLSG